MDRRLCQEWLDNVFVPHADSVRKGQKVLLLWDNCPGHKVDASAYSEWLRIELFPPNVTSVFQPMDQGIIVSVKRAFKRTMLLQVLDLMEDWDAVQRKRRWVHRGCAGLKEGAPAHIGDVAEILINIWENYEPEKVAKCWLKANILPEKHASACKDLVANTMKEANRRATTGDAEMEDTLCDIIAMLKSMPLLDTSLVEGELLFDKENGLDMGHASAIGEEAVSGLQAWLDYEDSPDVQISTMEMHQCG